MSTQTESRVRPTFRVVVTDADGTMLDDVEPHPNPIETARLVLLSAAEGARFGV